MKISIEDLFSHSFVISIDDERLSAFKQRFAKEQLLMPRVFRGFQYKNGVYKSAGIVKTSNAANVRLSNLAVVKMAEALDWPFVCVFEDDALPCIGARIKLEDSLKDLPDDIDMLKIGWLCQKNPQYLDTGLCKAITRGSHAYILFKKHYKCFQDSATKFFNTDIFPINDLAKNIFCAKELLFIQDDRQFKIKSVHANVSTYFFPQLSASGQLENFSF